MLIFSYYLGLGCDKLCDLKLKDVIISDNNIIVSIMSSSSKYLVYKLNIYDAFYISIIKRYFEITESLITEIGYFLGGILKQILQEITTKKIGYTK